ncbi:MAG TPA: hypothetical protein VNH44_00120 [Micropepsaceae bacterium]|nr:hypothetical protein [Micropepsaceae bacterium]
MIRKLAVVAVVALVPGFAFAAETSTKAPVSDSATHAAVSGDTKTDSSVKKTDASAKPAKTVHRVVHKAKMDKDKTKAGDTSGSKTDSKL